MSRGSIRRRGKQSWELKFDVPDNDGLRKTKYVTVRGKRQDAQRELTRLLSQSDAGTLIEPSRMTVAEYVQQWLDNAHGLAPKTLERYRELAERQIIPHLGSTLLQRLKPSAVATWHATLLKGGSKKGKPLSARTVGHAHKLLRTALQAAVAAETLQRNVASVISPPRVEAQEVEILSADQITIVLDKLAGHDLHAMAAVDLATGLRRGELLALPWSNLDLDGGSLRVERSLEETKAGLRFKSPKTQHGRRTISLPFATVSVLRAHRKRQLELRMQLGLGKPAQDALVFCRPDGSPIPPDWLTYAWRNTCISLGLPRVTFHALRHTHASALIAAKVDIVQISRRLGHNSPVVTLRIYAHLFDTKDTAAADAIEAVLGTGNER